MSPAFGGGSKFSSFLSTLILRARSRRRRCCRHHCPVAFFSELLSSAPPDEPPALPPLHSLFLMPGPPPPGVPWDPSPPGVPSCSNVHSDRPLSHLGASSLVKKSDVEVLLGLVRAGKIRHRKRKLAYSIVQQIVADGNDEVVRSLPDSPGAENLLDIFLCIYTRSHNSMPEMALSTFKIMSSHSLRPSIKNCNRLLRALRKAKMWDAIILVYQDMVSLGIEITVVTYNIVLDSLSEEDALKLLHNNVLTDPRLPNDVKQAVLIRWLARGGKISDALGELDAINISKSDAVHSYNPIIRAFFRDGLPDYAWALKNKMEKCGVMPNLGTYSILVYGLCLCGHMEAAFEMFSRMGRLKLRRSVSLYNTMISGYCRVGCMEKACFILEEMRRVRVAPVERTFNILIGGFCENRDLESAWALVEQMVRSGFKPDKYTCTILVNGLCKIKKNPTSAMKLFYGMLRMGLQPDTLSFNTIIAVASAHGNRGEVCKLLEEMKVRNIECTTATYNAVINGLCKSGNVREAEELLREMKKVKQIDAVAPTILIDVYCKKGQFGMAKDLFDDMVRDKLLPTVVTYTVLIHAYASKGNFDAAYLLFGRMLEDGVAPNTRTYNALINSQCQSGVKDVAYKHYTEMMKNGLVPNKYTYTSLIDVNINEHNWEEAMMWFNEMSLRNIEPDEVVKSCLFKGIKECLHYHAVQILREVVSVT